MSVNKPLHKKMKIRILHRQLVDQMKSNGHIASRSIEAAFRAVPRHLFLPDVAPEHVYRDEPIATKSLQERVVSSSSQPTMMAIMLQQLQLRPGQRVLEIGAGTGYNAALLAHIVGKRGKVVTIDIDEDIVERARAHLHAAGYEHVQVLCADGCSGYPDEAPYDRIILTVNAADIAPAWREQLKPDGRLLLPLSLRGSQVSVAFVPVADHLESVSVCNCRFVGLRGALAEEVHTLELQTTPDLLTLNTYHASSIEAATVRQWLARAAYEDLSTSVQVTPQGIQRSLGLWLATHEPDFCLLTARTSETNPTIMPMPFHFPGKMPLSLTCGLLNERNLCLLLKDGDESGAAKKESAGGQQIFSLKIRSFGTDPQPSLAHRLRAQIEAWQQAKHPDATRLHIKAYPGDVAYQPTDHELLVSKQWTQFVIKYKGF